MRRQNEMVKSFHAGHRNFIMNLNQSLDMIEQDIDEMTKIKTLHTGQWNVPVAFCLDEVAKDIYSISEPRWGSKKATGALRQTRQRVHDLYAKYRGVAQG
jgi:hypothetical protein